MARWHSTVAIERRPSGSASWKGGDFWSHVTTKKKNKQLGWPFAVACSQRSLISRIFRAGHLPLPTIPFVLLEGVKGGRNAHTPKGVELQNARITWSCCHGNGIYWKPQAAAAVSIAAKSSLRSLSSQRSSFQSWEGGKWASISVVFSWEVTIPSAFSEGFSRRQFSENGITCFKECFPISG